MRSVGNLSLVVAATSSLWGAAAGLGPAAWAQGPVTLSCVVVGGNPVAAGAIIDVECFLTNVSAGPQQIRGGQFDLPCSLPAQACASGTITAISGTTDPQNDGTQGPSLLGSIAYLFGPGGLGPYNASSCIIANQPGPGQPPVTLPAGATRYIGTIRYQVSPFASGDFDLVFECTDQPGNVCPIVPAATNTTRYRDNNLATCPGSGCLIPLNLTSALITVVGPAPSNDPCSNCTPIGIGTVNGSTTGASADGSSSCDAGPSPDVWYCYTPPADGVLSIDTCGSLSLPCGNPDTIISVHSACPGTGANELICDDDCSGVPCAPFDSCLSYNVTCGVTYYIRIAGFAGASGDILFNLNFSPTAPSNDACPAAPLIGNGTYQGTTMGATPSPPPILTPGCFSTSPDVWYRYRAQCSGPVTVDTCGLPSCGAPYDTVLSVYTGSCAIANQVPGACNDDMGFAACPVNPLASRVTFNAVAGNTYRFRVAGFANTTGNFVLNVSQVPNPPPPPNNPCSGAIIIPGGTIGFSTVCATTDGPPGCPVNQDIWYRWQAPSCSGPVTIHTCGSAYDTYLAIYTGTCNALTQVAGALPNNSPSSGCNDDTFFPNVFPFIIPCEDTLNSAIQFTPTPNLWYYIRVGGFGGTTGVGKLTIDGPNLASQTCSCNGSCTALNITSTRLFNINGFAHGTNWSWGVRSACCSNVQNLNVPGVPTSVIGVPTPANLCTDENNLAIRFRDSINLSCANGAVTAAWIPDGPTNGFTCGLLSVKRKCSPNTTPMILSVGPAGTPYAGQCPVADVFGSDPLGPFGPCVFNPEMEDVPLSGVDCNGNGEDDLIDIFAGTSLDEEGNGVPDECDVPCGGDADCDDGNDCTMDVCDLEIGVCAFNSVSCLTDADCPAGTCNPSTGLCSCLCGDACQLYGDVDGGLGDCDVDVDDLLYVLDGFSDPASFPAADIEPCGGGDGDVDVDDLLAELDAFSGIYACPHPCP